MCKFCTQWSRGPDLEGTVALAFPTEQPPIAKMLAEDFVLVDDTTTSSSYVASK